MSSDIASNKVVGWVCRMQGRMVGCCFVDRCSGEVVVLALLPQAEHQGLGRKLLGLVVDDLRSLGHSTLFLGCSADPKVRSYGFYRHLGWRSTGRFDSHGDEVLQLQVQ